MSSGAFTTTRYEAEFASFVMPIRVQPETLALTIDGTANVAPTGNTTLNLFARARKNANEYGVGARTVTVRWTASPPDGYANDNQTVPVLTQAAWDAYNINDTGTYLGAAVEVVSKARERAK